MYFQLINPGSDPEKVFITVKNSYSTSAITVGQAVCWDMTTDIDGVGVTKPSTALIGSPAGIVASASIASGGYGLVQVYGITGATVGIDGSSGTVGGTPLRVVNAAFTLLRISTAMPTDKYAFISGAVVSTGGVATGKKVFVRAL